MKCFCFCKSFVESVDLVGECFVAVCDCIVQLSFCIVEVLLYRCDCISESFVCFFDLVYELASICRICVFESFDCVFKRCIESRDTVSENVVVILHSCFEVCESLFESRECFFTVTAITNLKGDRCGISEVVICFFVGNDDRDQVFILESKYEVFAYSDQKCLCVTAKHFTFEHYVIKAGSGKFRGVRCNGKNYLVTGANNGNGRSQAKRKLCFFDCIGLFNLAGVVIDTFDYDGNVACIFEVSRCYAVSVVRNSVIITFSKEQTVNVNLDSGSLFEAVVGYVIGNVYVVVGNFAAFDFIGFCNCTCIVADTCDLYRDSTCGRKVSYFYAASLVRNNVICAFFESKLANLNRDLGFLCILVIDRVGRYCYVLAFDLCFFDYESLFNCAGVVVDTGNLNGDITCVDKVFLKVFEFNTVSVEFNSVISAFNKSIAANRNGDFGQLSLSVIYHVCGNSYVCISNFRFFDRISLFNRTDVIIDTFDNYGNFAYHGKVVSLDTVSVEFNSVISAFNESIAANSNNDSGFLSAAVIDYFAGFCYVGISNLCLFDCICDFDPTVIVTVRYASQDKGNFAFARKVGGHNTVSVEEICVVFIESKDLTVYSNSDFGFLDASVINDFDIIVGSVKGSAAEGKIHVFFFNLCRVDVINQCNFTFVVAHSFDHYVNFAYVGKIGGFFHNTVCIDSAEFNSVIRACNRVDPRAVRQLSGNITISERSGFLFLAVVNCREIQVSIYIAIFIGIVSVTIAICKVQAVDVYIEIEVIIFNVGLFDLIGFYNYTCIVADTCDLYCDRTGIDKAVVKISDFHTVSVEFKSVIYVFHERTVNIDPNRGHMIISVIDRVSGNAYVRRRDRFSHDLVIILENIFNRIVCISDFCAVVACINRNTVESSGMIMSKRIVHCITSIVADHHRGIFCEVPVAVRIGYFSLKTVINLIIVSRNIECKCTAVTVIPVANVSSTVILTRCLELVAVNYFQFPIMIMVGIFIIGTCFSGMIIYYVTIIGKLRNFLACYAGDGDKLIPIQSAVGSSTVQEIRYFAGLEFIRRLSCSHACRAAGIKVVASLYSAVFVYTYNTADSSNVNSGRITENRTDVIAAFDVAFVFTDNTADIGNGAADRADVIANSYVARIVSNYAADSIFAVNLACVIGSCYYAAIVCANNTADIVVTRDRAVIIAICYDSRIGANHTASIFVLTDNRSAVVTICYCSAVGTNDTADKSVAAEIRIFNAYVLDHVVVCGIACYITEKTDITYVLVVKIQSGNGIVITVKVTLKGGCLCTDGCPFTEIGAISVERTIVVQNAVVYHDIRSQFSVDGGIAAIDCRSKSIKLIHRVNLIKTVCVRIFKNDGLCIYRNGQVRCSRRIDR